jgi:hypothetical protein
LRFVVGSGIPLILRSLLPLSCEKPFMNEAPLRRPDYLRPVAERTVNSLEDKHLDVLQQTYQQTLQRYQRRRFWIFWPCLLTSWLLLPGVFWFWYRRRLKEWKLCRELANELSSLRRQRDRRTFWKRLRPRRNRVETGDTAELRRFYKTLVQSVRQYNVRLGLFDYALDRQNKRLDPPFTVGELEKIEKTFRRVQDELHSAIRLLQLAEKNPELDLVQLLRNEYQEDIQRSSEYVNQTVDLGASGQFIHELLVLETNLRQDIAGLAGSGRWQEEEIEEEEEATREEKNESEKASRYRPSQPEAPDG